MKVALVTGGSRGIGAEIARELGRNGFVVAVNYLVDRSDALRVVEAIRESGGQAEPFGCDVSDHGAVAELVRAIADRHGSLDVLVNNAGIVRDRSFAKMALSEWQDVLSVNLNGVMNTCAAAVPGMIERKFGRIVNISSFVAQAGNFGQTNYAAAKAGIIGFTRSLALELAKSDITVNAVCPGFIATDMWKTIPTDVQAKILDKIPMRRVGEPADVARVVRFIVTEAAYVTGQTLNVNGGVFIG
jgi:acetoacetyl-CoA reductase